MDGAGEPYVSVKRYPIHADGMHDAGRSVMLHRQSALWQKPSLAFHCHFNLAHGHQNYSAVCPMSLFGCMLLEIGRQCWHVHQCHSSCPHLHRVTACCPSAAGHLCRADCTVEQLFVAHPCAALTFCTMPIALVKHSGTVAKHGLCSKGPNCVV